MASRLRHLALFVLASARFFPAVTAQGCRHVLINTQEDADEVRQLCRIIEGSVMIQPLFANLSLGNINLDGVEEIKGWTIVRGCPSNTFSYWANRTEEQKVACEAVVAPSFNFSSSTLRRTGSNLEFHNVKGLRQISLPNLELVQRDFSLSVWDLERVDVGRLQRVGALTINAPQLRDLVIDDFQGFTGTAEYPYFKIYSAALTSLDNLFAKRIDASPLRNATAFYSKRSEVEISGTPNVPSVRFGLYNVDFLTFDSVRYGDPNYPYGRPSGSDSGMKLVFVGDGNKNNNMTFERVTFESGSVVMERDASLSAEGSVLAANLLSVRMWSGSTLNLPFDKLRDLFIGYETKMQSIKLSSPKALAGEMGLETLEIEGSWNAKLKLLDEGTPDNRTWAWPKTDMEFIRISADVHPDFFKSFFELRDPDSNSTDRPKVTKKFSLSTLSGPESACDPFTKLADQGVLPGGKNNYFCYAAQRSVAAKPAVSAFLLVLPTMLAYLW